MIALRMNFLVPLALACAFCASLWRGVEARKRILAAAGVLYLLFLFFYSEAHLAGLAAVLLANFLGLKLMERLPARRGPVAAAFIGLDTLLLAAVKYQVVRAPALLLLPALSRVDTFVVIGASFAYLRLVELFAEGWEGLAAGGALSPLDFFDYVCFFPAFVAGPIDRAGRFQEAVRRAAPPPARGTYEAVARMIEGTFKRLVLAECARIFSVESMPEASAGHLAAWRILLALFMEGATIYFEFSGYTDVAIGMAGLLGISLPENFDRPYIARNMQDFWSRWHMTFVAWLKDYLFYPAARWLQAAGVLSTAAAALISLIATFVLAGVWHGEGWNFMLYGLYHAAGFLVFLAYRSLLKSALSEQALERYSRNAVVRCAAVALTMLFVNLGWIFYLDRLDVGLALWGRL